MSSCHEKVYVRLGSSKRSRHPFGGLNCKSVAFTQGMPSPLLNVALLSASLLVAAINMEASVKPFTLVVGLG